MSLHLGPFPLLLATAVAASITVTGCGGGSSGGSAAAPVTTTSATSTPVAPAGPSTTVTATLRDFTISLDRSTFTAGSYTFTAKNLAGDTHALEIDGPGVSDRSTGDVPPGSTRTMTVTLDPGSYEIYCPVGNHKSMGMDMHISVT